MLKKTVSFKDFDGNAVTEDLYFHLSTTKMMEMGISDNALADRLQKAAQSQDMNTVLKEFKYILEISYGQPSEDRRTFMQSKELSEKFFASMAYEALMDEFFFGDDQEGLIKDFMYNILPENLRQATKMDEEFNRRIHEYQQKMSSGGQIESIEPPAQPLYGETNAFGQQLPPVQRPDNLN